MRLLFSLGPNSARTKADIHREMSNGKVTVKKEEVDDEIQIVHVKLRAPAVAPTEPQPPTATAFCSARQNLVSTSVRHLAKDAPPCDFDKEYFNGRMLQSGCPRQCSGSFLSRFAREQHYRKHHYNIYYTLTRPSVGRAKYWMRVQLGEQNRENRVCVRCVVAFDNADYYAGRGELLTHMRQAHPLSFEVLVHKYAEVAQWGIPDSEIHPALQAAMTEMAFAPCVASLTSTLRSSAAAAAPVAATSAPAAMQQLYWRGQPSIAACPRGCDGGIPSQDSTTTRVKHYKKYHYNIYYAMAFRRNLRMWTVEERWMCVRLGDAGDSRACVLCMTTASARVLFFWNRRSLAQHMQMYIEISRFRAPDSALHHFLQDAMAAAGITRFTPVAAAANTGVATATLHHARAAPISIAKANHHYNVYYYLIPANNRPPSWPQYDQWMHCHFGNHAKEPRVCVRCVGDARHSADYNSREELIRHMLQAHPVESLALARVYASVRPPSTDRDEEAHLILMRAALPAD
ncbi:hypothetical protein PRIPAC_72963 [Pristionchus pacificus]|uniref:Uncharacterized protein n=1 Tax=Pristionchus pacificus TaxID=54126 RepID=A0A2A6C0K0_PRIPA|nr:hypothetical protein PRIPAC_72963 [Pristionchus pacificus]|eukprot:PDM71704.1 hypothetical protein PRIPAC_38111 [Pristionchus pacificus]